MHPEILRELTVQRGREMRARAHQARLARTGDPGAPSRALPAGRGRRVVLPAIPDYVDGSFRTEPDSTEREASTAGATRHAPPEGP